MTLLQKSSALLLCLTFTLPSFAAKDPKLAAIKARQGEMQLRSFSAGPLFAMAKGKMPYDAAKAQSYANNLVKLLDIDIKRAWMKGTDNSVDDYSMETTALPDIWTTYPKIGKYGKKYKKAVKELAAVAGNGQKALKRKVGALGKACKGCHDEFREKN